jgi:hypothetical protein
MNLALTNPPLPGGELADRCCSPPGRGWGWVHGPNACENERALSMNRPSTESQKAFESGAEDARTPNAVARSADSASAKRLECVRFIGAFRPAPRLRGSWSQCMRKRKGVLHEPSVWCPGFSRSDPPEGGTPNKLLHTFRFMVPKHRLRVVGVLHVQTHRSQKQTLGKGIDPMVSARGSPWSSRGDPDEVS